jgi:hypothetical protein
MSDFDKKIKVPKIQDRQLLPVFPQDIERLFNHIRHGDHEHQEWLRKELEKFFGVVLSEDY